MHPAQRFAAPRSIEAGVPLKSLLDRRAVTLIGESFADVVPQFVVASPVSPVQGSMTLGSLIEVSTSPLPSLPNCQMTSPAQAPC